MIRRLFIDAGPMIAACNRGDRHRSAALEGFGDAEGKRLITTNLVVSEAATWLRYHVNHRAMLDLRTLLRGRHILVIASDEKVEGAAWDLLERMDDLVLSFADAVSAVVARREKCDAVFTFDSDFLAMGFSVYPGTGVGEDAPPYLATPIG